jgi:hypothetical protein
MRSGLGRRRLALGRRRVVGEPLGQGRVVALACLGDIGIDAGGRAALQVLLAMITGIGQQRVDRAERFGQGAATSTLVRDTAAIQSVTA